MSEQLPTYIGNCAIEETASSDMETDAYGLDTFVQEYQGRKDRTSVREFLKRIKAGATNQSIAAAGWKDIITPYQGFGVVTYTGRTDRSWAYFSVRFTGKTDNNEPPPQLSHSLNENTIQVYISGADDFPIAAEIDYLSPRIMIRYATKTMPSSPIYGGKYSFSGGIQIIARRGLSQVISDSTLAVQQRIFLTTFDKNQVGLWWQCEEEYELRFVQNLDVVGMPIA